MAPAPIFASFPHWEDLIVTNVSRHENDRSRRWHGVDRLAWAGLIGFVCLRSDSYLLGILIISIGCGQMLFALLYRHLPLSEIMMKRAILVAYIALAAVALWDVSLSYSFAQGAAACLFVTIHAIADYMYF